MPEDHFSGVAYSYARFSHMEQQKGDSIRRQRALRDAWLERHPDVTLDTTLSGEDLGVSAYRGANQSDKHHLGRFLEAVRRGRVAPGSILLLESLDRLSRQEEEEALALLLGLLNAGVVIVQMEPYTVFKKGDGMMGLMRALLYLSRAREESATKSSRVSKAWRNLEQQAAQGKKIITARCPAWLEIADGKFRFKPGALATLKRIFTRCVEGHGARMIAHDLSAENVPHFEGGTYWHSTYITAILRNRAVVGEYQPHRKVNGKRTKNGPPIVGYFPAALTAREFDAALKASRSRQRKGGRRGEGGFVALFAPVFDALTSERLHAILRMKDGHRYHVLQQAGVLRWGTKCVAFPLASFEPAILSRLTELDIRDVLPPVEDGGRVADLSGRLAELENRIARFQAAAVDGEEDESVLTVIRELSRKRKTLAAELATAQQEAASPVAEQWGTLRGLAAAAETDPAARIRIRSAAARIIERIDCVIVPGSHSRVMAVQIRFRETAAVRNYVITHANGRRGKKGAVVAARWSVRSFAEAVEFDLRDRGRAADLERMLSDPAVLAGLGASGGKGS